MKDNKIPKEKLLKKIIEKINSRKIIILATLFLVCFVLGVWGFLRVESEMGFWNAIYFTLTLFALNYSEKVSDLVLNIARFGASIFTVGGFLIIFGQGLNYLWNYIKGKVRKDSVFVFGETDEAKQLVESIGVPAVTTQKALLKAKTYVLMGNDEENLAFYYENKDKFGANPVYIRSSVFGRIMRDVSGNSHHTFFSTDEIVSKKYWTENHLLELASKKDFKLNVAIVGFNSLGEELLFQALQMNIFDANQEITYHLWRESHFTGKEEDIEQEYLSCFESTHKNLDLLKVVVHHKNWYEDTELLNQMDRIIVSDYYNAIPLVHRMLQAVRVFDKRIDVFYKGVIGEELFLDHRYGTLEGQNSETNETGQNGPIRLINYLEEGCVWEEIVADEILEVGKRLNWEWEKKYQTGRKDPDEAWAKLSAEKRFSNYASACSQITRSKLVKKWNEQSGTKENWDHYIDNLSELEHIRWCNYYWFNNWEYADMGTFEPDKTGERKNTLRRLHNDLQPYEDLAKDVQKNDAIQVEFGFMAEEKKRTLL